MKMGVGNKRKSMTALLLTVIIAILAACGGNGNGNEAATNMPDSAGTNAETPAANNDAAASNTDGEKPEDTKPPGERKKVQVMSWWDFTTSEPLIQLKAKFEELNPDLELEYLQIGTGYADKVLTMIAGGGDLPDVMMLAMDKVPIFADKGAILPLDSYMTEDYKKNLLPVVSEALQYKGQTYAAARDITSKVMFLNKKMFDDAGVAYPGPDWTWEEFRTVAKQLTKGDQWGFYFPKYGDGYTHFLMQNGGGFATNDGQSLIGKPESVEALQFLYDMIHVDKSVPTEAQAQIFGTADNASFVAGKTAMVAGGLSTTVTLKTNNVEYLIRPLPKHKQQVSTAFVNSWVIPKGAKDPELSWRVLEFLSGKDAQQIALDTGMGLPAVAGVDTAAFLAQHEDNKYLLEALDYSAPYPSPLFGAEFNTMVRENLDLVWIGDAKLADAVAKIEAAAPNVLAGKK